jgi:hypothetical protein
MPKTTRVQSIALVTAAAKKAATPTDDAAVVPAIVGQADAVERHRRAADALPLAEVIACRADTDLAFYNAMRGRDALLAARASLDASGFPVDWSRVDELRSLGFAVAYAAKLVGANPRARESSEVLALLRTARPLRRLMLTYARALSLVGHCPAAEVARIAKGRGPRDAADDLGALAALYTAHALVTAGGPVTAQNVQDAVTLGSALAEKLRPMSGVRPDRRTSAQVSAVALRDRLWTLFVRAYEYVEQAGGAVWGRRLAEQVPSLQARKASRKRPAKPAPVPAPVA